MTRAVLSYVSVLAIAAFYAHWLLSAAPGVYDPDSYYHFLVSRELAAGRLWFDIPWLPFTVLGEAGVDHHWLWHLLFAPFGWINDPQVSLHLALVAGFALVPLGITLFLQLAGVRYAALWALLALVLAEIVVGRLLMLRAQNLALLLALFTLLALYQRKLWLLFLLGFVFMASYHGAVILAAVGGLYVVWRWLGEDKLDWMPPLLLAAGVLAGLVITPWPGENIEYLLFHTLYKTGAGVPGMAGTEWASLSPLLLLREAWLGHLLLLGCGIAWCRGAESEKNLLPRLRSRCRGSLASFSLLVCLLFLGLSFSAWRFLEYYAPLAGVTAALMWHERAAHAGRQWLRFQPALLVCLLIVGVVLSSLRLSNAQRYDATDFAEIVTYLELNAASGEVVVNSHWPDFPLLLWPGGKLRFVAGLDGSYLAFADPARFALWWNLAARDPGGQEELPALVGGAFNSRWVVVNRGHVPLYDKLSASAGAELVTEAQGGWLFRLK